MERSEPFVELGGGNAGKGPVLSGVADDAGGAIYVTWNEVRTERAGIPQVNRLESGRVEPERVVVLAIENYWRIRVEIVELAPMWAVGPEFVVPAIAEDPGAIVRSPGQTNALQGAVE
jgi:hypothetical protein